MYTTAFVIRYSIAIKSLNINKITIDIFLGQYCYIVRVARAFEEAYQQCSPRKMQTERHNTGV